MTRVSDLQTSPAGDAASAEEDAANAAGILADAPTIGEGIRHERLRRGLTLAQLASRVNLTVSALSQIERSASDPSINSLRRIAAAFGIPMFQFLVGTDRREIVVRHNHRIQLSFPDRDLAYELVSADAIGEFEVLGLTLAPGGVTGPVAIAHSSEECSIVLRGHVLAEVAGRTYELDAGDSIKIHRELAHRFINQSSSEAELIIIISPPTF
jgi:transcriptional regulator with XRE-family HTH domain